MANRGITIALYAKNMMMRGLDSARAALSKFASGIAKIGKAAVASFALVGSAAVAVGRRMVAAYQIQASSEAKLSATLKATGYAAGLTASELKKHAAELQKTTGIGDETIISMQGILATFKQIKGDTFKRATVAILDMGAAMGKAGKGSADVESAVVQVGKALNDPIAGMAALSRVGVTFTDQQKKEIQALQESGDLMKAQAIILKELESEFGGTAKSVADANHGIMQMKAAYGDVKEEIGRVIVESSSFDEVIKNVTKSLESLIENGNIELWAEKARSAIEFLKPVIDGIGTAVQLVTRTVAGTAAFLGAISAGDSFKNALAAADEVPKLMKEQDEARLRAIRKERDARKQAQAEKEKQDADFAMLDNLESPIITETIAENALLEALQKDAAETEKKILEEEAKEAERITREKFEAQKDLNEKALADAQNLAKKRVQEVIDEAKAKKDRDKELDKDRKKAERLRKFEAVGTVLSKKDKEFLRVFDQIQNAKGNIPAIQGQIDVAKNNLEQLQKQNKTLTDLKNQFGNLSADLQALLRAG